MSDVTVVDGSGIVKTPVTSTKESLTLYVRSTGDDSKDGLTEANSLLTIQAAVNKIPKVLDACDPTIDIGEGTFAGFLLSNIHASSGGEPGWGSTHILTIQGVYAAATIEEGHGTNSGTSNSGDTTFLGDSTQNWDVNGLKGKILSFVSGPNPNEYIIASNTANSIYTAIPSTVSMNGVDYTIKEVKTVLDTTATIENCSIEVDCYYLATQGSGCAIYLKNLDSIYLDSITCVGSDGIIAWNCRNVWCYACSVISSHETCFLLHACGITDLNDMLLDGQSACLEPLRLSHCLDNGSSITGTVVSSSGHGVTIENSVASLDKLTCSNNALSGVYAENSKVTVNPDGGYLAGSGNTRFGMLIGKQCDVRVNTCTVTGVLGDYTFDDAFARTWAADLPSSGDVVVSSSSLTRLERNA